MAGQRPQLSLRGQVLPSVFPGLLPTCRHTVPPTVTCVCLTPGSGPSANQLKVYRLSVFGETQYHVKTALGQETGDVYWEFVPF